LSTPIVHFEIMGGANDQLQRFYAALFSWKIDSNNPLNYGVVSTGSSRGINGGVGPSHDGGKRVTVYAEVEDLDATLVSAEKLGGKTVVPPSVVPGGPRIALFADPAGNILGLMQSANSANK